MMTDTALTRINYYEAGQLSGAQFFYTVMAETAERGDPRTEEVQLVYGKSASYYRTAAALAGLQSLTLQGK